MHKKGLTEEVAKKRSRKTVKHQRGIVGADLKSIAERRNQTSQARAAMRADAITKAKAEKKAKEAKKEKTSKVCRLTLIRSVNIHNSRGLSLLVARPPPLPGYRSSK